MIVTFVQVKVKKVKVKDIKVDLKTTSFPVNQPQTVNLMNYSTYMAQCHFFRCMTGTGLSGILIGHDDFPLLRVIAIV